MMPNSKPVIRRQLAGLGSALLLLASAPPAACQDPAVETSEAQSTPRLREPFEEAVDVRLVEVYVNVLDRKGQPIRDLETPDFSLLEDGAPQTLASAQLSSDLPITLGLAIDTSASMFARLPAVLKTARQLISGLERKRDRAFVVGFGPEPHLAHGISSDLEAVSRSLDGLEADGRTPLWSAVSFALDELARAHGKRALIVLLDGTDEDSRDDHQLALEKARAVGIPIYLIVMNNEAARTAGKDFQTRAFLSRLERVAGTGGGAVHFLPTRGDLSAVYSRIEQEIRSAYLLTYYPTVPLAPGKRRKIDIDVARRGAQVRTVPDYDPGRVAAAASL